MFAKLYETKYGQILVKLDSSNDESVPEVGFFFMPEGLGVCQLGFKFADDDDGWDRAEAQFNAVTQQSAISVIEPTLQKIHEANASNHVKGL